MRLMEGVERWGNDGGNGRVLMRVIVRRKKTILHCISKVYLMQIICL